MSWPYMDVFHGYWVVRAIIVSGPTGNMIHHSTTKHHGCPIILSAQSVQQADGSSQLQVVGEIQTTFTHDNTDFMFEGIVIEDLDVEVLAGNPFMTTNDVAVRPAKRDALLGNGPTYTYGSTSLPTVHRALICALCSCSLQNCLVRRSCDDDTPLPLIQSNLCT